MRSRRVGIVALILLAASLAMASVDPGTDPGGWLDALDKASIADQGWSVTNLQIELGPARLSIEQGTLVPVRGPSQQTFEYLFVGKARFLLATQDPVESYQIDLFTGTERLDEPVTQAVFAIASDSVAKQLSARPGAASLNAEQARSVTELFTNWRSSREYRRSGLRLRALQDVLLDADADRFAAAWCDSPRLGHFLLRVDPYGADQIVVEQFVPMRIGDADKETWQRLLRREQSEGRFLGMDVADLGNWDVWYAGGLDDSNHQTTQSHSAFEPEHYDLDAEIDDGVSTVAARATIDMVTRTDASRVVELSLHHDLIVDSISLRDGTAVPWTRSLRSIMAVLPSPAAVGSRRSIVIRYHGVLFDRDESKLIVKRTTTEWYPHVGSVDLATYRGTFTVPSPYVLLGSGRVLEETPAGAGHRQVRVLEKPTEFFGFEIGKFHTVEVKSGHVSLTFGFLSDVRMPSASERDAVVSTIRDALTSYEEIFGPYPLDTLVVATSEHEFAQGFLSFLTIPQAIVFNADKPDSSGVEQRRTIAHELAHQWWGNLVGCAGDHEAWLSESLASYAAALFSHRTEKETGSSAASDFLDLIEEAQILSRTTVDRPVETMGPITLGTRLNSSLSQDAYEAIIYQKGPRVLAMLGDQLGEVQFVAMLKEIAQRANFRRLDTDTIIASLAKMSGRNLDAFMRSFVRGVGYPEIHFDYTSESDDTGFVVRGTIHQVPRGFRRDRLVQIENGGFDVAPSFREYQAVEEAQSLIPGVIAVEETRADDYDRRAGGFKPLTVHGFKVAMKASGPETPFAIKVPKKPSAMHLDLHKVLPTTVFNSTLDARRSFTAWAEALRSSGHDEEARAYYRKALAQLPEDGHSANAEWRNDLENGWIHIALAEMAADEGRFDDAKSELADRTIGLIEKGIPGGSLRYDALRARLALHAGNAAAAYKLLNGSLSLHFVQQETDTLTDDLRRRALESGHAGFARDYLVYAASAHATGHEQVCREASAEARRRGGDASTLDDLHRGGS